MIQIALYISFADSADIVIKNAAKRDETRGAGCKVNRDDKT
jgi:hypothetical protein